MPKKEDDEKKVGEPKEMPRAEWEGTEAVAKEVAETTRQMERLCIDKDQDLVSIKLKKFDCCCKKSYGGKWKWKY